MTTVASHAQPARTASVAPAVRPAHWTDYLKFIGHLLLGPVLGAAFAAASGGIDTTETVQLGVLVAGSGVVYIAENSLSGPFAYMKAICAWVIAVLTAALPFSADGWSGLQAGAPVIVAAAAAALGVGVLPNTASTSLADVVRDTLEHVQRLSAALPSTDGASSLVGAGQAYDGRRWVPVLGEQVRGSHAPAPVAHQSADQLPAQPATTAGSRAAASPVDTGTLEAVRARSEDGYLL